MVHLGSNAGSGPEPAVLGSGCAKMVLDVSPDGSFFGVLDTLSKYQEILHSPRLSVGF